MFSKVIRCLLMLGPATSRSKSVQGRCSQRFTAALLAAFVLIPAPYLFAQVSATISGTVTDVSGGAVAGAAVTVTNVETGAVRTTTTGGGGRYQVFALPIGQYEVHVSKPGFAEEIRTGIRLTVEQVATVDVTLRVGRISQHVIVNSDAPLVSPTTANVSGLVGEQ